MPATHKFATTKEAYDAVQCDDNIKQGDILVIESERVVGVADTWPFAVTTEAGALHSVRDDAWQAVETDFPTVVEARRVAAELFGAAALAKLEGR